MPSKVWTFELDGREHVVELAYSLISSRERFFVDDALVSDEYRMVFVSRYRFTLEGRSCEAVLFFGLAGWKDELTVDGKPVQMLPSKSLLRPASAPSNNAEVLVRPSTAQDTSPPEQLLRPGAQEKG